MIQTLRKVGLIGDVHAEDDLLDLSIRFLKSAGVSDLLCTGDVPDGLGSVDRACALLVDAGVIVVSGNHERWLFKGQNHGLPNHTDRAALRPTTLSYLAALPKTREFHSPAGPILLCHGLGEDDMGRLMPHDEGYALECNDSLHRLLAAGRYSFVLNGHSHWHMVRRVDQLTIINAGTLKRNCYPGFMIVDFDSATVQWYSLETGDPMLAEEGHMEAR